MKAITSTQKGNAAGSLPGYNLFRFLLIVCLSVLSITDISADVQDEDEWRQLFNGKDLTGWEHTGPGVVFKMQKTNSNSVVFIRVPVEPREEWMPIHYGYEVQIDNMPELSDEDEYHYTGTVYSLSKPLAKTGKPGPEWNTMEITIDGPRTIVYLNGVKVTDYNEGDPVPERKYDFEPIHGPRPDSGYIGVQNHGETDVVYFKEIAVKQLKKNQK